MIPRSIEEHECLISRGSGQRKQMWRDVAPDLTNAFRLEFDRANVSRKWQTLVDGHKRAEHYNKLTSEKGQSNFSMTEMSDLIADLVMIYTTSNRIWQRCDCAQVRRGRKEIRPKHTSNSFKTSALPSDQKEKRKRR